MEIEPQAVTKEILERAGLAANFVVQEGNSEFATAENEGYRRFIVYKRGFNLTINRRAHTKWATYAIFAHEIGHHLNFHTLLPEPEKNRPASELEADEWSGWVLKQLGAQLKDAQSALPFLSSETGSPTHPPLAERLAAVERGWRRAIPPEAWRVTSGDNRFGGTWTGSFEMGIRPLDQHQTIICKIYTDVSSAGELKGTGSNCVINGSQAYVSIHVIGNLTPEGRFTGFFTTTLLLSSGGVNFTSILDSGQFAVANKRMTGTMDYLCSNGEPCQARMDLARH